MEHKLCNLKSSTEKRFQWSNKYHQNIRIIASADTESISTHILTTNNNGFGKIQHKVLFLMAILSYFTIRKTFTLWKISGHQYCSMINMKNLDIKKNHCNET